MPPPPTTAIPLPRLLLCLSLLLSPPPAHATAAARPHARSCRATADCPPHHLCVRAAGAAAARSVCRKAFVLAEDPDDHGSLPDDCFSKAWPDVQNCAKWSTGRSSDANASSSAHVRVLESNNVPPFFVPPYCPFGLGQGYCQSPSQGNSTDCAPFAGKVCPCVPETNNSSLRDDPSGPGTGTACPAGNLPSGDVLVPVYQRFEFPHLPDPTDPAKPLHMYNNTALKTGNTYQVIGALLNGVQLKGPAEANGYNVDTSLIPLPCGGHVTPPVGPGPIFHHHKAPDCLVDGVVDERGGRTGAPGTIRDPGSHGPLLGYAADGFGIYGFGDYGGGDPVLDECNGQFGAVPPSKDVVYHYHATPATNVAGQPHVPYFMGCQGPSKGRCNGTVSEEFDAGANWCGQGCGAEICVQPGTDRAALLRYLDRFTDGRGAAWLAQFTVNEF